MRTLSPLHLVYRVSQAASPNMAIVSGRGKLFLSASDGCWHRGFAHDLAEEVLWPPPFQSFFVSQEDAVDKDRGGQILDIVRQNIVTSA